MKEATSPVIEDLLRYRSRRPDIVDALIERMRTTLITVRLPLVVGAQEEALAREFMNLIVRIFPKIAITGASSQGESLGAHLAEMAGKINSALEVLEASASSGARLELAAEGPLGTRYVGVDCDGWTAWIRSSANRPPTFETQDHHLNPITVMAAAALGAAEITQSALHPHLGQWAAKDLVLNLLDYQSQPLAANMPFDEKIDLGELLVVGAGSVGGSFLRCMEQFPSLSGSLRIVDPETYERRNLARYASTTIHEMHSHKAIAWAHRLEKAHPGLAVEAISEPIQDWVKTLGPSHRIAMVVSSPDNLDARREVAELFAKTVISGSVEGTTASAGHYHFATNWCGFCQYVPDITEDDDPQGNHIRILWSKMTGLSVDRVTFLSLGDASGIPTLVEADLRIIENHLQWQRGSLEPWNGRSLQEFLDEERATLYAAKPAHDDKGNRSSIPMLLPYVSALAGAMLAAELVKELTPQLHQEYSHHYGYARLDAHSSFANGSYPASRDRTGTCLCQNVARQRWYLELWPDDRDMVGEWSTVFAQPEPIAPLDQPAHPNT